MLITSKQNPKVKQLVALRERRARLASGLVLIDGFEELQLALRAGVKLESLYYCPELMGEGQAAVLQTMQSSGLEEFELSRDVFEKVSYREGPDGWLAVAPAASVGLEDIKLTGNELILICEAVEKPGNLGAMLRTADAAGATAVIAVDSQTDWGNPNIIRASKGTVFALPVLDVSQAELAAWLSDNHIKLVAASPSASQVYSKTVLTGPLAIMVGAEKTGLSDFWLQRADQTVKIPMAGQVDSLNVATSAAILLYEAVRQRAMV